MAGTVRSFVETPLEYAKVIKDFFVAVGKTKLYVSFELD